MKFLKYILIGVPLLLILVIGVGAFFLYTLDLNSYKSLIVKKAQEATGRELVISGDIDHKLFPRLGLTLGSTTFGNAEGFGDQPMASIEEVDINVAVLPLFKGKIEASKVKLHGLTMNLHKNAQGVSNWDDLISEENVARMKLRFGIETRRHWQARPACHPKRFQQPIGRHLRPYQSLDCRSRALIGDR